MIKRALSRGFAARPFSLRCGAAPPPRRRLRRPVGLGRERLPPRSPTPGRTATTRSCSPATRGTRRGRGRRAARRGERECLGRRLRPHGRRARTATRTRSSTSASSTRTGTGSRNLGYTWSTFWGERDSSQLGLGYTAMIVQRPDIASGIPFPAILPLLTFRFGQANVVMTYIPTFGGGINHGSTLYVFGALHARHASTTGEHPRHRRRRPRARARVEARAVAARREGVRRAGQRRHGARAGLTNVAITDSPSSSSSRAPKPSR